MKKTYKSILRRTHIEMIRSVVNYALAPANAGITQSIPVLFDSINSLQGNVSQIDLLKAQADNPITGYASQKHMFKEALIATSVSIMAPAFTFALATNNEVLAQQMRTTPSVLNNMAYEKLVNFIYQAINNVTPYVPEMANYNVTIEMLNTWTDRWNQLVGILTAVRNAIANRASLNDQIQTLIETCMNALYTKCDPLVESLQQSQPGYYLGYWHNRKLVNTGHISTQLRATVVDELNQPILNALVYIDGTDRKAATDASGYCLINEIPFGKHTVTVVTGTNSRTFGPFDFKKGQSLSKQFVTVPAFAASAVTTPAPVTVSVN